MDYLQKPANILVMGEGPEKGKVKIGWCLVAKKLKNIPVVGENSNKVKF